MRSALVLALVLVAIPLAAGVAFAPTASACTGMPEYPCCDLKDTVKCALTPREPCRLPNGEYYC